jgi:DNA-binding NarL/FixJ family response regulator
VGDNDVRGRILRVVVVEDHEILMFGLKRALEATSGLELVGATTGNDAVTTVRQVRTDIVLVDMDAHGGSGDLLCQRLKAAVPSLRCVLLSDAMPMRRVMELWHSGISGFADRRASVERLAEICRQAGRGVMAVDPGVCGEKARDRRKAAPTGVAPEPTANRAVAQDNVGRFSEREVELLLCLAEGMNNREIARHLLLAEKTVRNCLTRLFRKLEVTSRTQAAVIAVRLLGPIPVAVG